MKLFPDPRTGVAIDEIVRGKEDAGSFSGVHYERRRSADAIVFKAQYLDLDNRLLEVFSYVAPADANRSTYSVTLANLVKSAANLFELGSRWLYVQIFASGERDLKVWDYLSLAKFTRVASLKIWSTQFYDELQSTEVYEPFSSLAGWDGATDLGSQHVPPWWTASNKLKHTNSGLAEYGTLENAIAAVGATFLFLHAVFGPGLVYGLDMDEEGFIHQELTSSIFRASWQGD